MGAVHAYEKEKRTLIKQISLSADSLRDHVHCDMYEKIMLLWTAINRATEQSRLYTQGGKVMESNQILK